ncbi:hypothetical protein EVAR_86383_1 [Eumeta japonica]|uniref:Uncharacterized protein n=1 Tax=Eumeta variegata TaxID=151549 RepID=A0A4C1W7W3_EUMVA|nr:hypothetical protein EVAR_86383_1 [Eumeta japonica]
MRPAAVQKAHAINGHAATTRTAISTQKSGNRQRRGTWAGMKQLILIRAVLCVEILSLSHWRAHYGGARLTRRRNRPLLCDEKRPNFSPPPSGAYAAPPLEFSLSRNKYIVAGTCNTCELACVQMRRGSQDDSGTAVSIKTNDGRRCKDNKISIRCRCCAGYFSAAPARAVAVTTADGLLSFVAGPSERLAP